MRTVKYILFFLFLLTFLNSADAIENRVDGYYTLCSFNASNYSTLPSGFFVSSYSILTPSYNTSVALNTVSHSFDITTLRNHAGQVYFSQLYPTTDENITLTMQLDTDSTVKSRVNGQVFTGLGYISWTRATWGDITITGWYQGDNGKYIGKSYTIPAAKAPGGVFNVTLNFNSSTRDMTVYTSPALQVTVPYRMPSNRNLPYANLNTPVLYFYSAIANESDATYTTIKIYNITQTVPKKMITVLPDRSVTGFGLDAPQRIYTQNGTAYMSVNGQKGTAWVDVLYLTEDNIAYTNELLDNGWELGIHFSQKLTTKSYSDSCAFMDSEMELLHNIFGKYPVCWCSLANEDNVSHAVYMYGKYNATWRNGQSGVQWLGAIANIEDATWDWWSQAAGNGTIYPVFTHHVDQEPTIKYSINASRFITFMDLYTLNNINVVGVREYYKRGIAQNETQINILEQDNDHIMFSVIDNGYPVKLNVNMSGNVYKMEMVPSVTTTYGTIFDNATNGSYIIRA